MVWCVAGISVCSLYAQDVEWTDPTLAWLYIACDMEGLDVEIDGNRIGTTPIDSIAVPSGSHIVRVKHPDPLRWSAEDWKTVVHLVPGERRILRVVLPRRVWISSDPSGASVQYGETTVGITPLSVVFSPLDPKRVALSMQGYEPVVVTLSESIPSLLHLNLTAGKGDRSDKSGLRRSQRRWMIVTGIVAMIAGASGAYFRHRADRAYERYQKTGDLDLMEQYFDSARRFDTISGLCFGCGELSLGISLFLFVRGHTSH